MASKTTALEHGQVKGVADNYVDFFDASKGNEEEQRKANYETVVNSYYDLVTDFYEAGWGQSFHFAAQRKGEPYAQAIARHEHYIALKLGLRKGNLVLDCGCGVGGPARQIAAFSGAKIVGLNNNAYQVGRATKTTKAENLSHLVTYVKGNFMQIPAAPNSFDAVFAIEALCHAPDKVAVFSEIFRVLKPGACLASYEWCLTDKYNREDPLHRAIKLGIEEGDGLPDLGSTHDVLHALKTAGFEILEAEDLVPACEVPWYQPLEGSLSWDSFKASKLGRWCTHKLVNILEFARIAPKGTVKTHDFLIKAAENLCAGGKLEIFTPMYFVLVRKPLSAK